MMKKWSLLLAASLILFLSTGTASAQLHTFLMHDFKFGEVALAEEARSVHKGESYTLLIILSSNFKSASIENVSLENSSLRFDSMTNRITPTNWVINLNMTDTDAGATKIISVKVNYTYEGSDGNFTNESAISKIEALVGLPLPPAPLQLSLYQLTSPEFQDMPVTVKGTINQVMQEQNTGLYRMSIRDGGLTAKVTSTSGGLAAGDLVKVTGSIRFDGEIYSTNIIKILQLSISAPVVTEEGKEYNIIITADGRPVREVTVTVGESIYLTNASGVVAHRFNNSGPINIEAKKEDYLPARAIVMVEKRAPGFEIALPAFSLFLVSTYFQRKLLKRR